VLNPDTRSRTDTLSDATVISELCCILRKDENMTRKLRTALTAVLLLGLVAGGAGAAAAEQCDIDNDVDNDTTTIINDNDFIDVDDTLNNVTTNVLGIQTDDSATSVASSQMY
jgi:hypothetical protein